MAIAIVSGAVANKPRNGGASWTRLGWLLGLEALGFDVRFLERIDPTTCVDDVGRPTSLEGSVNLSYFREVAAAFGLGERAMLISSGHELEQLGELFAAAELLVNITGHLSLADLPGRPRRCVYVDLDPGYTQLWLADGTIRIDAHDLYLTVGQNVGRGSSLPTGGIEWRHVLPPVPLDLWPVVDEPGPGRFTTVAAWRGPYGAVEHEGRRLGLKAHEFRKVIELPRHSPHTFELALEIHEADSADRAVLESAGWRIEDPGRVASDPFSFRRYVQGSGAEFSAAQGIYVETSTGWFSDRTARYLASGKPAVVQDTDLPPELSPDGGLLRYRTLEEAVRATEEVVADYQRHSRAARSFAERHLDARRILGTVVEMAGAEL